MLPSGMLHTVETWPFVVATLLLLFITAAEGLAFLGGAKPAGDGDSVASAWERYCQVLFCANEFIYVD